MTLLAPNLLKSGNSKFMESGGATCTVTNSETAGPFPTIAPATLVQTNIVGDRTGVPFTINITIKNINNNCAALQNAIVDIWHCDKDGYYSEYGGTSMQSVNYTGVHFLRGRQTTDVNGLVSFTSIFPGWYQSRATHIHVHIYDSTGSSLLITQIAFPEGTNSAVSLVNSATSYGYTKGMTGYTYNASDNVFSDGTTTEMGTITGSISSGYTIAADLYVSATNSVPTGINNYSAQSQFALGQNYPNPCISETTVPLTLRITSDVKLELFNMDGRKILEITKKGLEAGEQKITLNTEAYNLATGRYLLAAEISNSNGTYRQTKILLKQ